jgi:predicted phosphodiesterase
VRIALISDIHGNEIALRTVLKEIDDEGVDATYCLGDLAPLGPHPRETIGIICSRGIPCVMGNHDEFLLLPDLIRTYPTAPVVIDAVDWCRAELSTADLDFLRTFEREITIPLNGGRSICLFHGSPRSHMEMILATTPADELDTMLDGRRGAVLAGGHTHLQMLRQHRGQLLVNAGSVGMPFEEHFDAGTVPGAPPKILDHAEYTLIQSRRGRVHVELRRVPLDRSLLRKAALDSNNPLRDMLAAQYA